MSKKRTEMTPVHYHKGEFVTIGQRFKKINGIWKAFDRMDGKWINIDYEPTINYLNIQDRKNKLKKLLK